MVLLLVVAAACGDADETPVAAGGGDAPQAYVADATVLESPEHGPELCLSGVAESYPPQCGGVPIEGWDWEQAEGEESANGTTWGSFHVVGTYDGETFTLTEPPGPIQQPSGEGVEQSTSPCPEPEGGWQVRDPARATQDELEPSMTYANAQPDKAAVWLTWLVDPSTEGEEAALRPGSVVLNVAFTGDLERHEAELEQTWGGPLCVVAFERSLAELEEITAEVAELLGDRLLQYGPDEVENRVMAHVVAVEPGDQEALDERFGEGVVHLTGALRPAD